MREPTMESALHAFQLPALARPTDASKGVWLNEVPHLGYISLRGGSSDEAFVAPVSQVLGMSLPTEPCTFAAKDGRKVLWLSPDEWLVVSPRKDHARVLAEIGPALKNVRGLAADNAGGYTQVLLMGRHAGDVLSHTSVYDISALRHGRVVGTTLGKSSVYLHRADEGYCLIMRRSFAGYIWQFLVRAAEQYGVGIAEIEASGAGHPP